MNDGIVLTGALRLVGRSVVANQFLAVNQVVMQSPTVQLDADQSRALRNAGLAAYCIAHPVDPDGALLLLSEAALCLTTDDACLTATATNLGASGWIVEFRALRNIDAGEELGRRDHVDRWNID